MNSKILVALVLLFAACKSKKTDVTPSNSSGTTTTASNASVNIWAYATMNDAYFWTANMPTLASLDTTITPADFYEKLIYNRTTVDRFSELTNDYNSLQNSFNGINKVFGIRYSFAPLDSSKTAYGMFLSNVVAGSPAEQSGLKRGDVIIKIDNTTLNTTNLSTIMGTGDTHSFSLGTLVNNVWTVQNSINITRQVVTENPVAFSKLVSLPSGKKLGYMVYTQFLPGDYSKQTHADSVKYDNQIRDIFAGFKASNISELVIDLRFNGGGYISSSIILASLIGQNVSSANVFYKEQWNAGYIQYFTQKYGANYLNHPFLNEPNNIGSQLKRVYFLTSGGTASASELTINGLKPYMPVILVGENTYGKNLFGTLIQDSNSGATNYGMYIMLGQTANSLGQSDYGTVNGMTPDYIVTDNKIPYLPFADFNETLFSKVLELIGEKAAATARTGTKLKINKGRFFYKETSNQPLGLMLKSNNFIKK